MLGRGGGGGMKGGGLRTCISPRKASRFVVRARSPPAAGAAGASSAAAAIPAPRPLPPPPEAKVLDQVNTRPPPRRLRPSGGNLEVSSS